MELTTDEQCLILGLLRQLATNKTYDANIDPFYNGGGNTNGFNTIECECGHIGYKDRAAMFNEIIIKLKDNKAKAERKMI